VTAVSVITPTWQRHDLLLSRCVPSVAAQDHPDVEHVVVSDGPDEVLREKLAGLPGVRFEELPEHDPEARWGHWARLHGIDAAKGDYITYCDDDDSLGLNHALVLAAALDAWPEAGFAYGHVIMHTEENTWCRIGTDPPGYGHITVMLMHRRGVLDVATWRQGEPTIDWDLVSRWMDAGVGWVMTSADTAEIWPSRYR
jgi:glycosyltransferase involved in cell wall biosynthesis